MALRKAAAFANGVRALDEFRPVAHRLLADF
jgi:hypothetical protein